MAPSHAQPFQHNPGGFAEPRNLHEFNERLAAFHLTPALTKSEFLLLIETKTRVEVTRALIAMHNGGQNRERACQALNQWVKATRALLATGVRAQADAIGQPSVAGFSEPTTLKEVNEFLAAQRVGQHLSKDQLDMLLKHTGRVAFMADLRAIHANGATAVKALEAIRAAIADAVVRVARGESLHPRGAAVDELPADSGADHGFEGTKGHNPTARADHHHSTANSDTQDRRVASTRNPHSNGPGSAAHAGRTNPDRHHSRETHELIQARAYGSKAALCVTEMNSKDGDATLLVEMAPVDPAKQKSYLWKTHKLSFQLMQAELLQLLAVLFGFAQGAKFQYHGPTKAKWLSAVNQGEKVYFSMGDKDVTTMGIPVGGADTLTALINLIFLQTSKTYAATTPSELRLFVRSRIADGIAPIAEPNRSRNG